MYVCICNAIRECELRKAARTSRGDAESLYIGLGRPPQCRQCIDDAEDIIDDERMASLLPATLPAESTFQAAHP